MIAMTQIRGFVATAVLAIPLVTAACQSDTANSPVTTTSPGSESTAPPASSAAARDTALVRVVHAIPAGTAVDVFADDNRVFENVSYKKVTPYREVDGQMYTFRLRTAGAAPAGDALASNAEGLMDGRHYTVFAVPGDGEAAALRVVADDHERPEAGKARVRVVNASRDAGEIDVAAAGQVDPIVDGVNFQSVTAYDEIDPVMGALEIRAEGEKAPLATVANARLEAGKTYTIIVVGRTKTMPKLDAFLIEDEVEEAAGTGRH